MASLICLISLVLLICITFLPSTQSQQTSVQSEEEQLCKSAVHSCKNEGSASAENQCQRQELLLADLFSAVQQLANCTETIQQRTETIQQQFAEHTEAIQQQLHEQNKTIQQRTDIIQRHTETIQQRTETIQQQLAEHKTIQQQLVNRTETIQQQLAEHNKIIHQQQEQLTRDLLKHCVVNLTSSGYDDPTPRLINVNGDIPATVTINGVPVMKAYIRGVTLATLNVDHCSVPLTSVRSYDTCSDQPQPLIDYILQQPIGTVLLGVTYDEPMGRLSLAYDTFFSYFNMDLRSLTYRGMFAFVGQKGSPHKTRITLLKNGHGPANMTIMVRDSWPSGVILTQI